MSFAGPHQPHRKIGFLALRLRRLIYFAVIFLLLIILSPTASYAQGCAQCRDNAAVTPLATQAAYRHAILLMIVTAGGLFLATLIIFKRQR
jgi:hypothetical protein